MGFEISRYSGLAFKVIVRESDGATRGLDVFGGFLRERHALPHGRGRPPVPAGVARAALRGDPGRARVPRTARARAPARGDVRTRLAGARTRRTSSRHRAPCNAGSPGGSAARASASTPGGSVSSKAPAGRTADGPSDFVRWVRDARARRPDRRRRRLRHRPRRPVPGAAGRARPTAWTTSRATSARPTAGREAGTSMPSFEWINLTELRSVLVTGAPLSRTPGPRVVMARHVLESTDRNGRENLFRLAKMVTRGSGRLYLQLRATRRGATGSPDVPRLDLDRLRSQVTALGGRILEDVGLDGTGAAARRTGRATDTSDPQMGGHMGRLNNAGRKGYQNVVGLRRPAHGAGGGDPGVPPGQPPARRALRRDDGAPAARRRPRRRTRSRRSWRATGPMSATPCGGGRPRRTSPRR